MRRLALSFAVLLAGCPSSTGGEAAIDEDDRDEDDGGSVGEPGAVECLGPSDCVAAASTCCECPAFAVPATSGYEQGCAEVDCEVPSGCSLVEPSCVTGRCELVCTAVATDLVCDGGFARDDFGCLVDSCSPGSDGELAECSDDDDCVQVAADCCGCARGGSDTSVPAGDEDEHAEMLACPPAPSCPGVDVCEPSAEPRCIRGGCQLVLQMDDEGPEAPSILCGTAGTPPCPAGQVCVLNHPDAGDATQAGAGSCQIP